MANIADPGSFAVVRYFSGKSYRAWTAKRLTGKPLNDNCSWYYVPARHPYACTGLDLTKVVQTTVVAPNDQPTWEDTRNAIEKYLFALWRQGGLAEISSDKAVTSRVGFNNAIADSGISQETTITKACILPNFLILLCHLTIDVD